MIKKRSQSDSLPNSFEYRNQTYHFPNEDSKGMFLYKENGSYHALLVENGRVVSEELLSEVKTEEDIDLLVKNAKKYPQQAYLSSESLKKLPAWKHGIAFKKEKNGIVAYFDAQGLSRDQHTVLYIRNVDEC